MIFPVLFVFLRGGDAIRDRVRERIFFEHAPQGTAGPCLIIREVSESPDYALDGEPDVAHPIVQIDAYDESPHRARELSDFVRNRLSGYQGDVRHSADTATTRIQSALIRRSGSLPVNPAEGGDKWRYRHSRDYEIFISQVEPNFT